MKPSVPGNRWDALDVLRGLTIIVMLLNLSPGSWEHNFGWLSSGFTLAVLGVLMPITQLSGIRQALLPARIFGENPLLAYILCFLIAPLIDANWFGTADAPLSLRTGGQAWFEGFLEPRAASFTFGLCGILFLLALLIVCHRRRWILKL